MTAFASANLFEEIILGNSQRVVCYNEDKDYCVKVEIRKSSDLSFLIVNM